jgi:superfamily II DNA or RNA helicase
MTDLFQAINRRVGKTIVFTSSIAQTKEIYYDLYGRPNVFMVHSKMTPKEREYVVSKYLRTPDAIMINCGILTAGFDDPSIETVIVYRATTSMPLWLQMCGRGSRIIPNKKDTFQIFDLGNNAERLLAWEANRDWKTIFKLQGRNLKDKEAPMKKCVNCEAVIFASLKICPYCEAKQPTRKKEDIVAERIEVIQDFSQLPDHLKKPWGEMSVKELIERAKYGSPKTGKPYQLGWIVNQLKERPNGTELIYQLAELKGYKSGWVHRHL